MSTIHTVTDLQLVEAIAAAISAMPPGASHADRLRVAIGEVRRFRPELPDEEATGQAKMLAGL